MWFSKTHVVLHLCLCRNIFPPITIRLKSHGLASLWVCRLKMLSCLVLSIMNKRFRMINYFPGYFFKMDCNLLCQTSLWSSLIPVVSAYRLMIFIVIHYSFVSNNALVILDRWASHPLRVSAASLDSISGTPRVCQSSSLWWKNNNSSSAWVQRISFISITTKLYLLISEGIWEVFSVSNIVFTFHMSCCYKWCQPRGFWRILAFTMRYHNSYLWRSFKSQGRV